MTAHKHAEMIKAKADNMDLVLFVKNDYSGEWWEVTDDFPFNQHQQFFASHPKHSSSCLGWLNGGEVEVLASPRADWEPYPCHKGHPYWSPECVFLDDEIKFRIKPRKEKSWIVVKNGTLISNRLFRSKNEAEVVCGHSGRNAQFIQIEAEVK